MSDAGYRSGGPEHARLFFLRRVERGGVIVADAQVQGEAIDLPRVGREEREGVHPVDRKHRVIVGVDLDRVRAVVGEEVVAARLVDEARAAVFPGQRGSDFQLVPAAEEVVGREVAHAAARLVPALRPLRRLRVGAGVEAVGLVELARVALGVEAGLHLVIGEVAAEAAEHVEEEVAARRALQLALPHVAGLVVVVLRFHRPQPGRAEGRRELHEVLPHADQFRAGRDLIRRLEVARCPGASRHRRARRRR